MVASSLSDAVYTKSGAANTGSAATSVLSVAACKERASTAAVREVAAAEIAAAAATMMVANTESARAAVHAADVAMCWVNAIHAKIEDAHTKIFQATLESSMQTTSKKATEDIEYLFAHQIERELEMQEAMEMRELEMRELEERLEE
ncbi:hypothetical protein ZWY2020_035914 [Hordeum vulgare]|nr:hypothetical protein ZWY2020_035914 [Hordeum vulgare]